MGAKFKSEWETQKKEDEIVPAKATPRTPSASSTASASLLMGRAYAIPGTVNIGESTSFPVRAELGPSTVKLGTIAGNARNNLAGPMPNGVRDPARSPPGGEAVQKQPAQQQRVLPVARGVPSEVMRMLVPPRRT